MTDKNNLSIVNIESAEPARNPGTVLNAAVGEYQSVLVLGYDENGVIDARASLNLQAKDILFLIEAFKMKLLNGDYSDD